MPPDHRPARAATSRLGFILVAAALVVALMGLACSDRPDARAVSETAAAERAPASAPRASSLRAEGDSTERVTLSAAAYATARIAVDTVLRLPAAAPSGGLDVPAQIVFDPARVALISPRAAGRIERLTVVEGDRVTAGQPVAFVSSPDFLTAQADFLQAKRRAGLLSGTPDAEGTAALAAAARQRLQLLGVPERRIARLEAGAEPSPLLPITAPFAGTIVERMALAGAAVQPGTPIFRVADVSVVNAIAQVPERALSVVHEGQRASVAIPAFPTLDVPGRVTRLQSELDAATRTVRAVVRVANPERRLRPGMFATVRLHVSADAAVPSSAAEGLIVIPERAVVAEGEHRYVFVAVGPRAFERRAVEVTPLAPPGSIVVPGGRVVVRRGLRAGELVVINGAFTLESELAKSQFGESEG